MGASAAKGGDFAVKLMFLTRSLEAGGAERQLAEIAKGLKDRGWEVEVACLYAKGALKEELAAHQIEILDLRKRGRYDLLGFTIRLRHLIRRRKPNFLYSFLPAQNVLATVATLGISRTKVVWGIRSSAGHRKKAGFGERLISVIERRLARYAHLIVANSQQGAEDAIQSGFPSDSCITIPNGFDLDKFRPDRILRVTSRTSLGVLPDEFLVGTVGRIDPVKNIETFLLACSILEKSDPKFRFVCVGRVSDPRYFRELKGLAKGLGLHQKLRWLPATVEMTALYNALDACVLTSLTEGVPNALGEAMCCGVPCVSTNVGDCAQLLGPVGEVAEVRDAQKIADTVLKLKLLKANRSHEIRGWMESNFGLVQLVDRTEEALCSLD